MLPVPTSVPTGPASPAATGGARRRVVDAPTRMFHALFALSFLGAYLTADGERWRALHVTLGYTLAGLFVFRIVYGLIGPRHARLAPLLRRLSGLPAWWRAALDAARGAAYRDLPWRQGLPLLMALAVVALLTLVVPLTLSGYGADHAWGDALAELHEGLGEALLFLALAHLGLVLGLSVLKRRNHALPMLTGRVDGNGPDLVRHDRRWLAALLLLAVLAFASWEWRQAPNGLLPTSATAHERHHDHDHDHND
jgi:cytochrome b